MIGRFIKDNGFTLVELIVVVVIMMVLVGVGSMSLNNFNNQKDLEVARNDVSGHLKLARNLAITKQLPGSVTNLKFVGVNIVSNGVTIVGVDDVGITYPASPYSKLTINTKNGVTVGVYNFGFSKSTGRLTDRDGNLIGTTMTVVLSRGTDERKISISNLGVISNVD